MLKSIATMTPLQLQCEIASKVLAVMLFIFHVFRRTFVNMLISSPVAFSLFASLSIGRQPNFQLVASSRQNFVARFVFVWSSKLNSAARRRWNDISKKENSICEKICSRLIRIHLQMTHFFHSVFCVSSSLVFVRRSFFDALIAMNYFHWTK